MRLADLVDLEVQLARDAQDEDRARTRDAELGPRLLQALAPSADEAWTRIREKDPTFRRGLLERWIHAVRERDDTLPGLRLERGYRLVGVLLAVLAVLLGAGTMQAILGIARPVNVTHFLGIFVFLQIALLLLLVLLFTRRGPSGWFPHLIRAIGEMRWVDRFVPTHARRDLERITSGLETHGTLYGGLERWSLFAITQRFACLFLGAGLLTFLAHVAFTHLTFGWATTLDLEAEQVHVIVDVLAFPWAPFAPRAVPDLALIEASRNTLERTPGTEPWWRFLTFALVVWALLPRLFLWGYGHWRVRRERSRLDHSHRALQRLYDRLLRGSGWEGDPEAAPSHERRTARGESDRSAANGAVLVRWRAALDVDSTSREAIDALLRASLEPEALVAGTSDLGADERALAALARDGESLVAVLAEGADSPTKDLLHFLAAVRERSGARRSIVVLLADRKRDGSWVRTLDEDLEAWRHFVETARDPYLRVERIEP